MTDTDSLNGTLLSGVRVRDAILPPGECELSLGDSVVRVAQLSPEKVLRVPELSRFGELRGRTLAMRQVFSLLDRAAPSDVTVIVDGWYGDTSRMYAAGQLGRKAERLIEVTHEGLMRGIAAVKPGNTFGDIGHAIQAYVESNRMSVVRDFCGHGLGQVFHAPPNVLHYGRAGSGPVLEEGMFFTIEPMVNLGRPETKILADDWTAVTRDKSLSAQYEHSVGVTADGCEIFTLSPADKFFRTWE